MKTYTEKEVVKLLADFGTHVAEQCTGKKLEIVGELMKWWKIRLTTKKQRLPLGAVISCAELFSMQLHEIIEIHHEPYFRIMRVVGGWMYNFYDTKNDEYFGEWIYVPKDNDLM